MRDSLGSREVDSATTGCGGSGPANPSISGPQPGVIYYIDDHLGSSHLVTDSLGNVLREESRFPYGLERTVNGEGSTVNGESVTVDYVYTGKEYDVETGLIYFGGRYYAPELGRWITPDPLFLEKEPKTAVEKPLSANLYAYVKNNPMTYVDEKGWIENERDMFPDTFAEPSEAIVVDCAADRLALKPVSYGSTAIAAIPAIVKAAPAIVSTVILHPEAAVAFVESTISNFIESDLPPMPTNDPVKYGASLLGKQLGDALRTEYDSMIEDYNEVFGNITITNHDAIESDMQAVTE